MKQFQNAAILKEPYQVGRLGLALRYLHQIRMTIAKGKLNDAETVAVWIESHGFGVDGDNGRWRRAGGKIAEVQANGHGAMARVNLKRTLIDENRPLCLNLL